MKLFLDCEFDGFGGDLISMALVGDGVEWYEVLYHNAKEPWVIQNVIPYLGKPAISKRAAQDSLHGFLLGLNDVEIVADYPADIAYFCRFLETAPGKAIQVGKQLKMTIEWGLEYKSAIPHNALEDARALRHSFYNH